MHPNSGRVGGKESTPTGSDGFRTMLERLSTIEERYNELERLLADPEISGDYSRYRDVVKEHASLRNLASLAREYRTITEQELDAKALMRDEQDRDLAAMAREELAELEGRREKVEEELRVALLPKDPNDEKNVIMEIRAAAGGDEAGLFAADLFRMYTRYGQRKGWRVDVINSNRSGLGAIKEIVFQVKGEGAYSLLKHESGTHRVQRIPTTESGGRIHTSTGTVAVLPEAEEVDVDIKPDDLQIDVFNASGHGGQSVQKNATAIRITHIPSGIVTVCQDERSLFQNREKAMAVLRARLLAREIARQQQEVTEARRSQIGTGDRSERARTYNFPQNRVTDHRSGISSHSLTEVMDGDIDAFIDGMIVKEQARLLQETGV